MIKFANEETDESYQITHILGNKVEIVPIQASQFVPQCKKRQAFEHTQQCCAKEPKSVKCTCKHITSGCRKPQNQKLNCVNRVRRTSC